MSTPRTLSTIEQLLSLDVDQLGRSLHNPSAIRAGITGPVMDEDAGTPPAGEPPAGTPATPPAGTPDPNPNEQPPAGGTQTIEVTPDIQKLIDEAATKASRAANKEAEALRKRVKAAEDAEQARKDAELTDAERLAKERDDATKVAEAAQAELRATRIESAILAAATDYADPTDALTLAASIQLDDDGKPIGVAEAVAGLLAAKPHYGKRPGTPALDASNGGRQALTLSPQQQTEALRTRRRGPSVWG